MTFESVWIPSRVPGIPGRHIRVFLPPGYDPHSTPGYPTLYLHDGQNVFAPGGPFGCWRAEQVAGELIGSGRTPPFIIIAIDNDGINRRHEYVPPGDAYAGAEPGRADAYARFVLEDIMPLVNARWRTRPEPEATTVGGSSLGGVVSLYLALETDRFGGAASLSTAICWAPNYLTGLAGRSGVALRLYHDIGTAEYTSMAPADYEHAPRLLHDRLTALLVNPEPNLRFVVAEAADHNEAAWHQRLPDILTWLMKP
ncbi:MAG TPA: alpha/beta hydrolase-fold protein [Kiritimatiellia bacterium]|nr:alpha/beta hydrolase-fold protein [Kiritimatiellia bacterium]HMO98445.1 alpha/beta hydrolase-fold protein [Kiritimatiellia bacterium]HMP95863.1 alpha/beta hydrolase-fold protein [Kiritimatiellia bacterium]